MNLLFLPFIIEKGLKVLHFNAEIMSLIFFFKLQKGLAKSHLLNKYLSHSQERVKSLQETLFT